MLSCTAGTVFYFCSLGLSLRVIRISNIINVKNPAFYLNVTTTTTISTHPASFSCPFCPTFCPASLLLPGISASTTQSERCRSQS